MVLRSRVLSLVLCSLSGGSALLLGPGLRPQEASAQAARQDDKKRELIDLKTYEREKNREIYGELANQKRQDAIAQLKKILQDQPHLDGKTKAEMLMRLAELYHEQSKYEYLLEMDAYDKTYEKWFNLPSEQQAKTPEPKLEPKTSRAYVKKAIENYRNILQNFPDYPRSDEALFFLSFMLDDIGEDKDALDNYSKLVRTYPESTFVPDAWNAIGEYYFANNNAFKALQAYKKAAEFKDSGIYTFALYKMGWCYFNVGEYDTAIETMTTVIDETRRRREADPTANAIALDEEALRDLVTFYAEDGDLEEAKKTFKRYGDLQYYRKLLARLGSTYMEQGKLDLAITTFRELIAENPNASDNPDNQGQIITAYKQKDDFDQVAAQIDELISGYGKGSKWEQENLDNKNALRTAEELIEKNLHAAATDAHQQALKRKSAKLLMLAEQNYKRYLDYFPTGQRSYELRYWYAEVLYKEKKYEESTEQYEQVVASDAKGKFLKDAARNTIFSIQQVLKPIEKKLDAEAQAAIRKAVANGEKNAAVPLHPWEERQIKAIDTYARVLPDDEETPKWLYTAALTLHDRNHYVESNERFLQLIRKDPASQMAEEGVQTVLDSYAKIEDWPRLNSAAREFYANDGIGKTEKFKKELRNIFQRATFKIAEGYAADGKQAEAAKGFEDFYREFADSDVRDLALYNASYWYGQNGDKPKMVALRTEFVDSFPEPAGKDSKDMQLYEKSLSLLGEHYDSIADYGKSAEYFRKLWDKDKGFAAEGFTPALDGLYNAALFREARGETDDAVANFRDYMAASTDSAEKLALRLRIAKIYGDAGRTEEAKAEYKKLYSDKALQKDAIDAVLEAWVKYGRLLPDAKARLDHYREGMKLFDAAAKGLSPENRARFWAAEMRFGLLEDEFASYSGIRFANPDPKKAKAALGERQTRLKALEAKYIDVLNLKQGEWAIAALYRIGTLYADFANELTSAPCPPKLDEDQCTIYKFSLTDRAYPLIEKAVEAFTNARAKSYELGLYTKYTVSSLAELTKLRPEEYPASAEDVPEPTYASNPYTTDDFVK